MRTGKLAEPVRKRSVLRQLNKEKIRADELYGTDCMPIGSGDGGRLVFAAPDGVPDSSRHPERLVTAVMNSLLASGAEPVMLTVQAALPEAFEEAELQHALKRIMARAGEYGMGVVPGQMEVSKAVFAPQYIVNGIGQKMDSDDLLLQPGQDLVLTRWIALGGTAALAEVFEEELKDRYPFSMIDKAKKFEEMMSAARDARAISHFGATAMHALAQGGIFGALWEMAERAGVGLEVDLKKIPVKQETIEICEYFDINPYELYSAGSILAGTGNGEALVADLAAQGIPAAVIGRVTDGNGRIIRNGEDCRYLDRPRQDEWYGKINR